MALVGEGKDVLDINTSYESVRVESNYSIEGSSRFEADAGAAVVPGHLSRHV